jgi:hypothetical protein
LLIAAEGDDDDAGLAVAGLLCASHLSSESARPLLLLLLDDGDVAAPALFFLLTHFSDNDVHPRPGPADDGGGGDVAGLPPPCLTLTLCLSHLPAASARLGLLLGGELGRMMAAHGGAGSSGSSIVHLGGDGSRPGRAACAMARCTRATGIAIWIRDGRRRRRHTRQRKGSVAAAA